MRVAVTSRSFSRNPILRKELSHIHPNVTFNDAGISLRGDELINFLKGHDSAIIALEPVDGALLDSVPEIRVIGKYGVGLDNINLQSMEERGVKLGWTGGVNRRAVAELVLSFVIALFRQIPQGHANIRAGEWRQLEGRQINTATIGLIGCGNVGREVTSMLRLLGANVLVHDITNVSNFCREAGAKQVPLEQLLREADAVSLHVPLTKLTAMMISNEQLGLMKSSAVLINTSRGGIVDEEALENALKKGIIRSAAFDVFAREPPDTSQLPCLSNFLATPHIGGGSEEAILAMGRAAIQGLENARNALSFLPPYPVE